MILRRLVIDRLPGIDRPFEVEPAGQGIQVIFGPNGIGKSSICRAVAGLYWDKFGSSRQTQTSCVLERDGGIWRGEREGSTVRWSHGDDSNAAPGFPASHNYRCFFLRLRDLIDPSRKGTNEIAAEIRRQMAGGFDLQEVRSDLFPRVKHRRKRGTRDRYNRALLAVHEAEGKQGDLQRRADLLDELRSRRERAQNADRRRPNVVRAIDLARRRDELARVKADLLALPEALAGLNGKEGEEVERLGDELNTIEQRALELERKSSDARRRQQDSGLASPLDEADLAAWSAEADELGRDEHGHNAAQTELESVRKELIAALHVIGGDLVDNARLTLPDHADLFGFLRAGHEHQSRVRSIETQLKLLSGTGPAEEDQDADRLRNGIDALRVWLRSPQQQSLGSRARSRRPWLLAGAVMLFVGVLLAERVAGFLLLLAGAGAGIGLAALFMGAGGDRRGRRSDARARFEELGLDGPANWDISSVQSSLQRLESRATALAASMQGARDRQRLISKLDGLREEQEKLDLCRRRLRSTLGLDSLPADAELVDFARALDGLRLACGRYDAATGKLGRLARSRAERLTKLADVLERHGEPQAADAADAAAVKARLNMLQSRNLELKQAIADEQRARHDLKENAADRETKQGRIDEIYAGAKLDAGDRHGLARLLEALPQYGELSKEIARLESQNDLDRNGLDAAGESDLVKTDAGALEQLRAELKNLAAEADSLNEEIIATTRDVDLAQTGHTLQDLIAAREDARADLHDLRDKALLASAGDFLLDEIEREFEAARLPRVFERARDHFSSFTFHNYDLCLDRGRAAGQGGGSDHELTPRLYAFDLRAGQRRELDELSDGTRAQLLLAARIAFAEEVERGKVLPLFLDEALDQSDPQRFEAIVRSLGCVARDQGRQILYLTSDPLDVERIREALRLEDCELAAPIDLGRIRTGAASIAGPGTLAVPPRPTVPVPEGRSPEEYAATLGVPEFDPAGGFADQHVFYVLWDDANLVHALLTEGIERAGQWRIVAGTALAARLAAGSSLAVVDIGSRIELLEVFCELWKQGRGRKVDSDALRDSGALSSRYLDDVVAIASELDGNARLLLALLEKRADSRLKRFRSSTVDALRSFLTEHRYRDERPIFDEDELRLRALSSPAANELADGVAGECLHRWWRWAQNTGSPAAEPDPN